MSPKLINNFFNPFNMTAEIYIGLKEPQTEIIRDYRCKNPKCWYCELTNRKTRTETVIILRPICAYNINGNRHWDKDEDALMVDNVKRRLPDLISLFPNRTRSAIASRLSILRKKLDVLAPCRERNRFGYA